MEQHLLAISLKAVLDYCDSHTYYSQTGYRPLIGVSANLSEGQSCINNDYTNSVIAAGGIPVLIPVTTDAIVLKAIIAKLDGILLTGGGDLNPVYMNEEPLPALGAMSGTRDQYDLFLLKAANDYQLPVFGICRGHQVINVLFGGTLFQDIVSQIPKSLSNHKQTAEGWVGTHQVLIEPDCRLATVFQEEDEIYTNSFHHQAIKNVANGFTITAYCIDGMNEGQESNPETGKEIFSVQWHPERMASTNAKMLGLFKYFVGQAELFHNCKQIHNRGLIIDSHVDTPMCFKEGFTLANRENTSKVSLPKMEEGRVDAVFMAAYLKQGKRDDASLVQATQEATDLIAQIKQQVTGNSGLADLAFSREDLMRNKRAGKKSVFIGIENGYAIGKDLGNIARFKDMGVSYITLCHNGDNDLCDSAKGTGEHNGLSELGRRAVAEMNRLGMMVDISHTSEKTVFDVLATSKTPVIASHSSARALCDHPRNLNDEQLKAIAAAGGVVQVCLYHGFLTENEKASLLDAVRHIDYMVKLIGEDHVGIGSDFDGDGGVRGCNAENEMINLTRELLRIGYSQETLEKIWGGNLLRVMDAVRQYAGQA